MRFFETFATKRLRKAFLRKMNFEEFIESVFISIPAQLCPMKGHMWVC